MRSRGSANVVAAAGGATLDPRGVNENKVNAFSPYYLVPVGRGVSKVREAGNQNSEQHGGNLSASLAAGH